VRRAVFQIHLWAGISLSLYIVVICASGSAIVFRRELDKALCPTNLTVAVRAQRLTTAELRSKAHAAYPRFDPKQIEVRNARAANAPVEIRFFSRSARLERLFDPYTGADLADPTACEPHFVTALAAFHDNLGAGRTGLLFNGLGALAVTLICLSGAILWWPGKQHWLRATTVKRHLPWHRFVRDLHGALGFWLVLLVLFWAVTGIYFAFPGPFNALAEVIVSAGARSLSVDDAMASVIRLHFGRAFGRGVELLWVILGLLPATLVVTGVMMWWHRVVRKVIDRPGKPSRLLSDSFGVRRE
jgi:uncharacterized iron-regulated membrane protein